MDVGKKNKDTDAVKIIDDIENPDSKQNGPAITPFFLVWFIIISFVVVLLHNNFLTAGTIYKISVQVKTILSCLQGVGLNLYWEIRDGFTFRF